MNLSDNESNICFTSYDMNKITQDDINKLCNQETIEKDINEMCNQGRK